MNAIEFAECLELYAVDHKPEGGPAIRQGTLNKAAEMLRKQHEAIVQLRETIIGINSDVQEADFAGVVPFSISFCVAQLAGKALKDTEHLK